MHKKDWNPELYLKFNRERIQPSIDLVSRIEHNNPETIIDIGCGPGNSTYILKSRWPQSDILGIDSSEAMIEKAGKDFPEGRWLVCDAGNDDIPGKYDVVFSNAVIQWIPDHPGLIKKFRDLLHPHGVLAVQVPLFFEMPLGKALVEIADDKVWKDRLKPVRELFTIHTVSEYYDLLTDVFSSVEMWVTEYMHVMDSREAILDMMQSTGLKPYLERLDTASEKERFMARVLELIKRDYPLQQNGSVLFPFRRLFFLAG